MANIPIFIPHAGCKNECAFCNQKSITGQKLPPSFDETEHWIEESIKTLSGNEHTIAFFGGSFTGIGKDLMEGYLSIAQKYVDKGYVKGIRLSTRPDYITDEILYILSQYSVTNIELGAQSLDDNVLLMSKRGHTKEDVCTAARLINNREITLGLQMMVGLPGDSREKCVATAEEFVRLNAKETRIYPTVIIKNTLLEKMYEAGEYVPMSFDEAIDISAEVYDIFTKNGVKVLKIGLHASDELKKNAVGGFYHDALGEMVYSRAIRRSVEKEKNALITYNKRFLSKVLGHKKENLDYFDKKGISCTLKEDNSIDGVCVNGKIVLTI